MSRRTFNQKAYEQRKAFLKKSVSDRAAFMQRHCNHFTVGMTRLREEATALGRISKSDDRRRYRTQKHAVLNALRNVSEEAKHLDSFLAFDLLDADGSLGLVGDGGLVGGSNTIVQMASKLGHTDFSEVQDSLLREGIDWLLEPARFALLNGISCNGKVWHGRIDQDLRFEELSKELLEGDAIHIMSALLLLGETGTIHAWNFRRGGTRGVLVSHYTEKELGLPEPSQPPRDACPGFALQEKVECRPLKDNGETIESDDYIKMGSFTLKSAHLDDGYHIVQGRVYGRGNFVVLMKGQHKLRYHDIRDFEGKLDHEVADIVLNHPVTTKLLNSLSRSISPIDSPEHDAGVAARKDEMGAIVRRWLVCGGTRADICFRRVREGELVIQGSVQTDAPFTYYKDPPLNAPARKLSGDDRVFAFSNIPFFMERFEAQLKEYHSRAD